MLGDLTDAKDKHPAELVNRIIEAVTSLTVDHIYILAGNHDWLQRGQEFFRFLNKFPHITFITKPWEDPDPGGPVCLFLPYSKNPYQDWKDLSFAMADYVFMHQTVSGAIASNGQAMEGEVLPSFKDAGKVYSGDIHVPQVIGAVEYVGSPYHVHFGDNFTPRCILLDKKQRATDLHYETIRRVTLKVKSIQELKRKRFTVGDQVKLRIELPEADKHAWSRIRREATEVLQEAGVITHGIELNLVKSARRVVLGVGQGTPVFSPPASILRFVEREELGGDAYEVAMEVLES